MAEMNYHLPVIQATNNLQCVDKRSTLGEKLTATRAGPCRHPGRAQHIPAPQAGAPCVVGSSLINTSAGPRGCTRLPCIPAKEGLLLRCGQSDAIARGILTTSASARAPESWYCITPAGSRDRTVLLVRGDIAASSSTGTSTPRVVPRLARPCSRSRL